MKQIGIYQIKNIVTNKLYIGSSSDIKNRFRTHRCNLSKNKHYNKHLQSSYNKYGESAFQYSVLEYCDPEDLEKKEQGWMDWVKPQYNKRKEANSNLGVKRSEETKRKISEIQKGKKQSAESNMKRSLALKGRKLSEINKIRIGESNKKYAFEKWHKITNVNLISW